MNAESPKLIELTEYVSKYLDRSEISEDVGEMIWQNYKSQISIDAPSFKNKRRWALTSLGWVGHIPLNPEMALVLSPKIPIENIFGMLEYAYRLKSFEILDGLADCDSLLEFYERLANVLALCRFFLEQSGPSHRVGEKTMLPFLVDMAHLYELFVAEWLRSHRSLLSQGFSIKPHEKVVIGEGNRIRFDIDLVFYEGEKASCVLDTKYKAPALKNPDLNQIVTYAVTKECREAILIYPKPQEAQLDENVGLIRVRSLTFSLDGDLDRAGERFLQDLFSDGCEGAANKTGREQVHTE